MTIRDISRMIEAHNRREQAAWERTRLAAYFAVTPYLDKKSNMTAEKLIPYPWDKKRKAASKENKNRELTDRERRWLDSVKNYMDAKN